LAVTQRRDTTTRYPYVGKRGADLPSGKRANTFTDDERVSEKP
jgi:hypothetical protein